MVMQKQPQKLEEKVLKDLINFQTKELRDTIRRIQDERNVCYFILSVLYAFAGFVFKDHINPVNTKYKPLILSLLLIYSLLLLLLTLPNKNVLYYQDLKDDALKTFKGKDAMINYLKARYTAIREAYEAASNQLIESILFTRFAVILLIAAVFYWINPESDKWLTACVLILPPVLLILFKSKKFKNLIKITIPIVKNK